MRMEWYLRGERRSFTWHWELKTHVMASMFNLDMMYLHISNHVGPTGVEVARANLMQVDAG